MQFVLYKNMAYIVMERTEDKMVSLMPQSAAEEAKRCSETVVIID